MVLAVLGNHGIIKYVVVNLRSFIFCYVCLKLLLYITLPIDKTGNTEMGI